MTGTRLPLSRYRKAVLSRQLRSWWRNSIDPKARTVTITRSREHGRHFLAIRDDGEGVPRDARGRPDFRYVATHLCDSVKRRLKANGSAGLQGEFGIGLLSFWTVGEELTVTSTGTDQRI